MPDAPVQVPPGTELLESSAGTGKTFAIAGRTTTALALGQVRIGQILLVTFARAATEELGERVRTHLHRTVEGLTVALAGGEPTGGTPSLYTGDPAELALRRDRLRAALGAFDEATITTTHTFCSRVLRELGVLADFDPTWTLRESFDALVEEIVDDGYLARYRTLPTPPMNLAAAQELGRAAAYSGPVRTPPQDGSPDLADFVQHVHTEFRRRKRLGGLLDYDDLQMLLRDALADPVAGARACQVLRNRYRLVLVDEFQDTDPVQWDILSSAFHGHVPLVLVGDPKQAIYAFRGGDIATYLRARSQAGELSELPDNWRSDADVVHAVGHLLRGRPLGDQRITVTPVHARHGESRIRGVPGALRLRALRGAGLTQDGGPARVAEVRPVVVADLVARVRELLGPQVQLCRDGEWGPLHPADIAVLVHTNGLAELVQQGLRAAGVPAVHQVTTSVLDSVAARDWGRLLGALAQPTQPSRARQAALTVFVGWDGDRLARAQDVDEVSELLAQWGRVLDGAGIGALFDVLCTRTGLPARVLARPDGERLLTDLRHITDLLQAQEGAGTTGAAGLSAWLTAQLDAERGRGTAASTSPAAVSRRLESDEAAVTVMTIHRAKGLEFPVVLLPFVADQALPRDGDLVQVQDGATRLLARRPPRQMRDRRDAAAAGERLRLLYVALTRAASHLVVWWSPSTTTAASALHTVLFAPPGGDVRPGLPGDDEVGTVLAGLAATSQGTITCELVDAAHVATTPAPEPDDGHTSGRPGPDGLSAAGFTRGLDQGWRRTSYSGLTAPAHEPAPVTSEPEDPGIQDEPDDEEPGDGVTAPVAVGPPVPMAGLPGGTGFGTLVHAVLEEFDPAQPDPAAHLAELTAREGRLGGLTVEQSGVLASALLDVVRTPLGELAGGRTLAGIPAADRLNELGFELPLAGGDLAGADPAGGDRAGVAGTLAGLADLIETHLPADDPLAGYPAHLRAPELAGQSLRGYLTGSIDAVLRVRDDDTTPRYLVVDYKTNRLAGPDEELCAGHYRPGPMAAAMIRGHYPLQALLYQVALHRYLRWRQPGYHPARHLGGVLYLFVRGMTGPPPHPDGPPTGVFAWRPPAALVEAASDLLAGRR